MHRETAPRCFVASRVGSITMMLPSHNASEPIVLRRCAAPYAIPPSMA